MTLDAFETGFGYVAYMAIFPFIAIILPLIYYRFISGFFSDVVMHRITKASFNLEIRSISDLWFSYFIGMISFLYLIYNHTIILTQIRFASLLNSTVVSLISSDIPNNSNLVSNESVLVVGLALLYIGRIITKRQGVFYGKIHFSAIFLPSALLLFAYTLIEIVNTMQYIDLSLNGFVHWAIRSILSSIILLDTGINGFLDFFKDFAVGSIIGTAFLSSFGEGLLSIHSPNKRSLLTVAEKFPSDFKTITGIKCDIHDKISEMFDHDTIISMRCVTRSLAIIDDIFDPIESQYITNIKQRKKMDYKILKSPRENAIEYYDNSVDKLLPSLGDLRSNRKNMKKDFRLKYDQREKKLESLTNYGRVKCNEHYFQNTVFIITESSKGAKKMLLVVRDTGPRNERVGLYTEEPYIIKTFEGIFDAEWPLNN